MGRSIHVFGVDPDIDGDDAVTNDAVAVWSGSSGVQLRNSKFRILPDGNVIMPNGTDIKYTDDTGVFAKLLGRAGGQKLSGGTGTGEDLTLESTSAFPKGIIKLLGNDIEIGTTSITESKITFKNLAGDGVFQWSSADQFEFLDDVFINTNEQLRFRSSAHYINSPATGELKLHTATVDIDLTANLITLTATTTNLDGNVHISNGNGLVVGHTAKIDFGATPEFQVLGTATPDSSMGFARFENNASGPDVRFLKSRGATIGANVLVQDGDTLGRFRFQGADGGDFNTTAAQISAEVDGTAALNDVPGRLIFTTRTAAGSLSEKMRLDNAGRLGIGLTNPGTKLEVAGVTTSDNFISDVATGTQPYAATSTTVNTNLNADLLDGVEAAAFPLLAGRSGGQTIIGGTDSANRLVLESTSHSQKGTIEIVSDSLLLGVGPNNTVKITFNAVNDGILNWNSSSNRFEFDNEIIIESSFKLKLGENATYINRPATGELSLITATTSIKHTADLLTLTATTINLVGTAQVSGTAISVAGHTHTVSDITDSPIEACRVYHNTTQSINDSTNTVLAFNSERFDTDTMHDTSTNNSRVTFITAGKYIVIANIAFASTTAGGRRLVQIYLNGTTVIAHQMVFQDTASASCLLAISTVYDFAASDYVEVRVAQITGGALDVTSLSNQSPEFMAHRLS